MSVCAQTTTEDESGSEEADAGPALPKLPQEKVFSKCVRVLIVIAYLFSVSLAAILLSVYYVWIWKSPELPALNETEGELEALQGELHEYYGNDTPHVFYTIGGSNTTVSDVAPTPANISLPALEPSDVTVPASDSLDSNSTSATYTDLIELTSETTNITEYDAT